GFPGQSANKGIQAVVEFQSAYTQLARVVGEHRLISQVLRDIALEVNTGGVRRPEEFVSDEAGIPGKTERGSGFHASRAGERVNAGPHCEVLAEFVIDVSGKHHLRALTHSWIGGPGPEIVSELWIYHPSQELELQLLQLKVLALDHGNVLAESVG